MGDTWGNRIKLTIFGESHGPAVGIVMDGLPAGLAVDMDAVARDMARRAPGQSELTTPRKEADAVEVLSGLHGGKTTGSALCAVVRNHNTRSGDYNTRLRPGHADLTALLKHKGHADMRGGGHFSGRLTAPLVFAGAVAKQALIGVGVYARIAAVGGEVFPAPPPREAAWRALAAKPLPVASDEDAQRLRAAILAAKDAGDSVGGVIEVTAFGVPGGLGDPFFASLESEAASLFFSIPAVKGVEFGDGFALAGLRGSQANDPIRLENGRLVSTTNHNGGVLGGITNGMPVTARIAVKPTPSIGLPQPTVDAATMTETILETRGRHDPCIVPRCVPVAEAALALAILDCIPCDCTPRKGETP